MGQTRLKFLLKNIVAKYSVNDVFKDMAETVKTFENEWVQGMCKYGFC